MARKTLQSNALRRKNDLRSVAARSAKLQDEISAEMAEKTNVQDLPDELKENIIYLEDDELLDDPINEEVYGELNVEEVANLSAVMKERGFQGVLLAYPVENGKYMIESGHRRRLSGRLAGIKKYPVLPTVPPKHRFERVLRLTMANLHNRPELKPLRMANLAQNLYNAHEEEIKYKKEHNLLKEGEITSLNELVALDLEMTNKNVEKYRRLLKLNDKLQEIIELGKCPWSYLCEASNLSVEKQEELAEFINEKIKKDNSTGSFEWVKIAINKLKKNEQIEKIELAKNEENKTGRVRRKNGTKIVFKSAKELHEVLDKDALFKENDIPDVLKTLENLKESIEKKIEELNAII